MNHILVRRAASNDMSELVALNLRLQYQANYPQFKESSFLLNSIISVSDFDEIIEANEIVVAIAGTKLIGYYLLDNHSDTKNLRNNEAIIIKLIKNGALDSSSHIAKRAQAAVDFEFRHQHICELMLKDLVNKIGSKFDLLFSSVPKSNPAIHAHLKMGWEIIFEDANCYYGLFKVVDTQNV